MSLQQTGSRLGRARVRRMVAVVAIVQTISGCASIPSARGDGYCLAGTRSECSETEGYPGCQPCDVSPGGPA